MHIEHHQRWEGAGLSAPHTNPDGTGSWRMPANAPPSNPSNKPLLEGGPGITPLNPPWKLMWWGMVPDRAPEGELVFMSMNSENTGGGQTHNWTVREMDSSSEGSASSQGYQTPGVPPPPGHWSQKIWAQIRGKTGLPLHQGGGSWSHRTMETQAGVPPALVEKF